MMIESYFYVKYEDDRRECWKEKTHPRIATTSFLEIL
jgi:hypothetical protein